MTKKSQTTKQEMTEQRMPSDSDKRFFSKLEEDGMLIDNISSLGWAFWPRNKEGRTIGFFDEHLLRKLADEIERRNKPFWDEYEEYCNNPPEEGEVPDDVFESFE